MDTRRELTLARRARRRASVSLWIALSIIGLFVVLTGLVLL